MASSMPSWIQKIFGDGSGFGSSNKGWIKSWPEWVSQGGEALFKGLGKFVSWLDGSSSAEKQYQQNLSLQEQQQAFNSAEAEKQRQYETEMANSQFQRGAADLRAAGLNPWLMVQNGGAAVPSASAATSSASSVNQRPSGAQTMASLASTAVSAAIIAKIVTKILK